MKVKIELVKSPIGYKYDQRQTAKALGLRKMHDAVVVEQTPQILGMVRKISHLVRVEQVQ
ncbi:MAG: 50S ribosomal protein L30 [Mesoaciditoga sp.]|uniref:50S ribosomal protein L30 n=1 Tax=Athalassotoga sp. TaxID=2022597 RepID=UPI000CBC34D1|nr:MAG: 50S ribosomal protein L30 [Mesoaciditoga sp.]PMP79891.1 MAG: 50S ribosomal protein L30 [Mesoaciditoga sp.]HEU23685.1 50S ribosomal protein L30 [Mesoaciditoga lauensis]